MKEEKITSSEESLEIITQMINKAKFHIQTGSFYFLLWGWLILLITLGIFFFEKFTQVIHTERLWLFILVGFILSFIYGAKNGRKEKVRTYAGNIYTWVWMGFLITYVALLFILICGNQYWYIGPVILILAGYATFLSGIIIKFKPLIVGAVFFWVLGIITYFVQNEFMYLLESFAMLCGYLIPGYMLKYKKENEHV